MAEHKDNDDWAYFYYKTADMGLPDQPAVFEALVYLSQRTPCEFPQNLAESLTDVWAEH